MPVSSYSGRLTTSVMKGTVLIASLEDTAVVEHAPVSVALYPWCE